MNTKDDRGTGIDALTFIGTATTLLRMGPFTILTDPNFLRRGQRAYLGYGMWTRRRTEPSMRPDQLPRLDAGGGSACLKASFPGSSPHSPP